MASKYTVIKTDIKRRLTMGEWVEGHRLPTSREFSQYYNSSVNTVEKAIKELEQEGWLIRDGRRGTFMDKRKATHAGRTHLVAAFVMGIENPLWSAALRGAEDALYKQGYHLLISSDDRNYEKLEILVRGAVDRKVEGVILSPIMSPGYEEINNRLISLLQDNGIKIVFLDRIVSNTEIPYVTSDNMEGAYNLTKLLLDQGHRRILFIRNTNVSTMNERLFGFKQAIMDYGIEYSDEFDVLISTESEDFSNDFEAYCNLFEQKMRQKSFTAIFTANDLIAEAAIRSFEKLNYRIPEDVSLVTYDAENLNRKVYRNITGVSQPFYEMGHCAAKKLLSMMEGDDDHHHFGQVCKSTIYLGESVIPVSN
ncbi:GntR family transcriptional regulator [Paenibacillus terrigena]|uniref:GntR family transcriptional regulator n=1 Tax=Paenibacillus terrigena TaxID=369333 RepID=UPI00039CCABE|nr:GntR family transcriptional regulator [Paenibacillus terrigena]